jgi:hypothetical protein
MRKGVKMTYKFETAHAWLDYAVRDGKISTAELLSFIHIIADSDQIQDNFQSLMDADGYFDDEETEDKED